MTRQLVTFSALVALAMLACAPAANANLLVGHYEFDDTNGATSPQPADAVAVGMSSNMWGSGTGGVRVAPTGCIDGYYGPDGGIATGTTAVDGAICARSGASKIFISITNGSGADVALGELLWDEYAAKSSSNGSDSFDIIYEYGDLTDPAGALTPSSIPVIVQPGDWDNAGTDYSDRAFDLGAALTDNILADGESATFSIYEHGSSGPPYFADNIAITAAIPEPSTFVLAVLGLLGLVSFSRRR